MDYIFLSREVPLSLSVLKSIKESGYNFNEIINFKETQFKNLLISLKRNNKIPIKNIDEKVYQFVSKNNEDTFSKINRELELCKRHDIKCLSFFDKNFPYLLQTIKPTPKLIFIKGSIKTEDERAVAIIGTREPTQYGREMAIKIAKRFTELGFTIVSGLARGIDTIAIKSALENGGRAIGVIASGILNLYPKENENLVKKLVKNGALISERFPSKSVNKRALQIRNRITSGFALGNIFVEGNRYSGSKWQLGYGKKQGRISIAVKPIGEYDQAYVPNLVINQENGPVISEIEDVDYIAEILLNELKERKHIKDNSNQLELRQTNLLKF
ncbi:MAG: DNA-processing protein DprA [Candidatus Thorarchaeota archaeon]